MANLNINLGPGAFRQSIKDYYVPYDIFNYQAGFEPITTPASGDPQNGEALMYSSGE